MAIATYATDLNDFEDFEAASTISTELTGYTDTSKGEDQDSDFPIQGSQHASAEQRTAATGSLASDYGSNITWTSGWSFFLWGIFLAPAAVNTDASAGIEMAVGASITAFHRWTVGGSDFGRYPYGGWQNFVVDPEVSTGRTTTGSPGTNYRWVGMLCDVVSAISKGSPYGIDVIRYGRGEISTINGQASAYGTFEDMATANDASSAKWGLFQETGGSYLWKGLMSLGTTTASDFRDANRTIVIDNTRRVQSTFNKIEVNHASSNIEWTAISITALGTTSKGAFEAVDDATIAMTDCTFTDMDTFIYQSNSTLTNTTFRRCGQITQGSGTFDDCTFDDSTSAVSLVVDSLADVSDCTFNSDGSNHAVNLGTVAATTSMSWNNYLNDYATYSAGGTSTGNEAILVNVASGQTLTINVGSGYDTPSYYNTGTGDVDVVNSVTVNVYVKDSDNNAIENAAVAVYKTSDDTQIMNELSAASTGLATESFAFLSDTNVYIRVRKSSTGTRYIPVKTTGVISSSGLTTTVVLIEDNNIA